MKKIYFLLMMVLTIGSVNAQIAAWDFNTLLGNEVTVAATTLNANLAATSVSRGAGLNASALANSFSSTNFTASGTFADAVTNNKYVQFTIAANSSFKTSLSTLDVNFRRSSTGPNTFQWQYSLDGFATAGVNIGSAISYTLTTTGGDAQTQINLSAIPALQNVANPTVITFRLYGYGATAVGGTFALGRLTGNDLAIGGTVVASGPSPTINVTPATLTGFTALSGVPSAEQSYSVDGSTLTAGIVITPPVGFEITTTSGSGYVANPGTITLPESGGVVNPTTIYVRMNSATLGTNTGNITHTSTGANNPNVSLTGQVVAPEPLTQSSITIGTVTTNSIVVNFSGGDGAKRILLAHLTIPVNSDPVDGTTYTANAVFGSGTQIGTGNYVVYAGTGNTVTVTGLSPSSIYNFAVYEYNDAGIAGAENYLTPGGTGLALTASTDGDYRSVATGNWSDIAIWQTRVANLWIPAVLIPISTSNVYIQFGHTVTVDIPTATCNDIHINNATAVLAIGVNTLEVNGKIRSYVAAAAETTIGVDGIFYSAQVNTNLVNSTNISSTAGLGKMKFVGTTRTISYLGEWGNNPALWDVEFAPTAGETLTIQTGFKARNITVISGTTISTNTDMRPDGNAAGVGTLTVKSGATLNFSNNSITIQRIGGPSATSHFGTLTVEAGGVLEFSGISSPIIGAAAFVFNGTVIYSGAGAQNFIFKGSNSGAVDPVIYTNVTISNSGVKTTIATVTTTINGTFSLQGTATSALGASATLAYGAAGILEYKGSVVQTTGATPAEWPTVNGPFNLTINNTNGVTLNATSGRRINGALTLTNGILTTSSASTLTMGPGSTIPTLPTNASFVFGPVKKIGNTAFTFPVGNVNGYVPIGVSNYSVLSSPTDELTAEYIRASGAALGPVTAFGINRVSACEYWTLNVNNGTPTVDLTLYWNANNPCNGTYISNVADIEIAHFGAGAWNLSSVGFSSRTGTTAAGNVTWTNVSTFSPFTIASTSGANPLPITINYFTGTKNNGNHLLNWKVTCVSTPNASMELQRSTDGRNFNSIYSIFATAVECQQPFNYTDNQPAAGVNYYRLKMTDADGKVTYSSIVSLINAVKGFEIMNIAPNPIVNRAFNLKISAAEKMQVELVITDMQGRVMQKQSVSMIAGFNSIPVNVHNLASGTYQVFGNTADGRTKTLRFVIQ
ncbi:MAG: T9SS type A sorting domain-containing protein [Ferruginibacter sp.]